jgi:hypothetical protein
MRIEIRTQDKKIKTATIEMRKGKINKLEFLKLNGRTDFFIVKNKTD